MTEERVIDFYTNNVREEWRRLFKNPYRRLEFDTTMRFLKAYLPANGLILDAGGGPGRYTIELARCGYDVVLLDMTPANLEFARRKIARAKVKDRVTGVVEGSIVDLSTFADDTFDAVICLGGPLSHVVDAEKREQAITELVRIAKPGAPIFVSVIGRLSLSVIELTMFQWEIELPHYKLARDTGDYMGGYGFTACHFFLPEELNDAFQGKGVSILEMVGLEGISSNHSKALNRMAKNETRWPIWLETHYQTCTHPAIVGLSEHMLIVCRKS